MTDRSLRASKSPSLPSPAVEGFTNVLRLYFTQLDNITGTLLGDYGGRFIDCPIGLFFSTATQTAAAANTGYPVTYTASYFGDGVSLASGSRVVASYAGVFNFQFSAQLNSTNSSSKDVFVWMRRNGTDIGYSTRKYTLAGTGQNVAITWDFDLDLDEDEYLEVIWATTDVNVTLAATAPTAPHPGIASAVISVNFIAPLPDPRPTPP